MPVFNYNNQDIHYEFRGEPGTPVVVFVNGLTQRTDHWVQYTDDLNKAGFQVLSYDLLGQGTSSKPVLFIDFYENPAILAALLDHLHIDQVYIGGVSFGGVIVLRFGIEYPDRVKGLIPMSCFTEMDATLSKIGTNLHLGMTGVGFEYLVSLLIPINFSSKWMAANQDSIPQLERNAASYNDLYGIQNLMESIRDFKPFTHDLKKITCPTLILNGEYDNLTPRWAHELMRVHISSSRLMLMQHVCHAFTIEIPEIVCRVIADFIGQVENGTWVGDKSVWVATDDPTADEIAFPCHGDHTRNIPFAKTNHAGNVWKTTAKV